MGTARNARVSGMTLPSPAPHLSRRNPTPQPQQLIGTSAHRNLACVHSIQSLDFLYANVLVFFVIKIEKSRTRRGDVSYSRSASHVAGYPSEALTSKVEGYARQHSLGTASLFVQVLTFLTGSGSYSEISVTYRKHRAAYQSNRGQNSQLATTE